MNPQTLGAGELGSVAPRVTTTKGLPAMKHPTEPSTKIAACAAPYLPTDLVCLLDTHAIRIDHSMKRRGSWCHQDVKTVRRAIRAWLRHQGLPTHEGCAVPLYWLHDWLTSGPCVGPRTPAPDAAWEAHLTLVYALNQQDSGLELIQHRLLRHAS